MRINTRGFAGTFIVHLIVLIILLFFGFSYPDPPPAEQGILVNFGTDETGLGNVEPAGDESEDGNKPPEPLTEKTVEKPQIKQPKQEAKPVVNEKNGQDIDESKVKEKKLSPEEIARIELEKKAAEELKKKQAEEARQKQIADQWNSKGKNAFGNKGVGTGTGSEGITSGTGNQGSPEGTPGADNYGPGGGLGNGEGFGLGGRGIVGTLPKPVVGGCTVTSRIIIKVQINVDREGNVVDQKILESNYQDECIYQAVVKAAASAKFTIDEKASFRQQGWIRYVIEP